MKTLDLPRRPKTEAILAKEARAEATQCVVSWLQKLKPEKRPDKPGNRAPSESDAPQFPPDRNSLVLVIGSLVLIFVMIAILLASDISPDKNAKRELDSAAPNAENTQQHPIGVKPGPVRLDDAPASTTPHWVFPPPTQTAVIRGLPGSPYRTPLTRNPGPRRFDAEWDDAKEQGIHPSAPESRKERLKTFATYLVRYRNYVRELQRHRKAALRHRKNTRQGFDSFFAAIGHALGF